MSLAAAFWVIAGFAAGIAACFVLMPMLRTAHDAVGRQARQIWIGAAAAIGLFGLAVAMYLQLGRPDALETGLAGVAGVPHSGVAASGTGPVDSMEVSVQRLAAKLADGGGTDAEWDLLAQSYDFLGNAAAAAAARQHRVAGGSQTNAGPAADVALYEQRIAASPADTGALLGLAMLKRSQRDFAGAVAAYEKLQALNGMTADAWADYADALASRAGGSLQGPAADAIEQALTLDSGHPKALWLKATLAIKERRYADAEVLWQQLRGVLPPDSPDIRIIDANIAEATALASSDVSPVNPAATSATSSTTQIKGTVEVDPALIAKVTRGMTLFVYAKAANAPGPPLAVLRQPAGTWPASFVLDDALAMLPDRRLSDFEQVIIEARLSKTGQAIAAPGDLQGASVAIDTREARPVTLKISQVIG